MAIPIHPDLAAVLARIPREHLFIVTRNDGRPCKSDGFKSIFHSAKKRLGPGGLQFNGLRHTAGKLLAEAGCTDREIMAILGHQTASTVTRYTRSVEQKRQAEAAFVKLKSRT